MEFERLSWISQASAVADRPTHRAQHSDERSVWLTSQGRRLNVDRRMYRQLCLTDDAREFITLSVYLCQAQLTTPCDDRRAVVPWQIFKSKVFVQSSRRKYPYFWRYPNFLNDVPWCRDKCSSPKFLCKVPEGSILIFGDTWISLNHAEG